jgi:two-component system chemotaxis response regulator CheY
LKEVLKVLIVDDLKSMREEFSSVFRQFVSNAHIDEASDVWESIGILQKENPPYDLIFTDLNMPGVSGLRLISHIRELPLYKKTPIIVISLLSAKKDIEWALEVGADGYLTRPLQIEDFDVIFLTYIRPLLEKP